uniref:Sulfotransferase n=1 Tax=Brassica oleracea TaxID=3712 RepID=A0A3P6F243_BRAOL|nr:unnamed protein product [Brassica oleracea]
MLHLTKVDQASFERMFEAYCRGVILYGPYYWEHVFNYLKGSLEDKDHILFTKYEEIIEEQRLQVKRLPEFLQLSIRQGGRREWIGGELV